MPGDFQINEYIYKNYLQYSRHSTPLPDAATASRSYSVPDATAAGTATSDAEEAAL